MSTLRWASRQRIPTACRTGPQLQAAPTESTNGRADRAHCGTAHAICPAWWCHQAAYPATPVSAVAASRTVSPGYGTVGVSARAAGGLPRQDRGSMGLFDVESPHTFAIDQRLSRFLLPDFPRRRHRRASTADDPLTRTGCQLDSIPQITHPLRLRPSLRKAARIASTWVTGRHGSRRPFTQSILR
jgi:hypothetical protein